MHLFIYFIFFIFFSFFFFWLIPWLCISKMIYSASEGTPVTFQITQNGKELRKSCQSVWS
jgi:hypothetical protein